MERPICLAVGHRLDRLVAEHLTPSKRGGTHTTQLVVLVNEILVFSL